MVRSRQDVGKQSLQRGAEAIDVLEQQRAGLSEPGVPDYRPTMHYAYRPCDDAVLSLHEIELTDTVLNMAEVMLITKRFSW